MLSFRIIGLVLVLGVAGCVIGMPRFAAGGVETTVTAREGNVYVGQLLAAHADSIILLDLTGAILSIHNAAIGTARFKGAGTLIRNGALRSDSSLPLLRAISAFPQGISDSLMQKLRQAHGAAAPRVVRQ
jgi:hypothetical protein